MGNIIDFGAAEGPIKEIEEVIEEYNMDEKLWIVEKVKARLMAKNRNLQARELSDNVLGNMSLGSIMKKFKKKDDQDD